MAVQVIPSRVIQIYTARMRVRHHREGGLRRSRDSRWTEHRPRVRGAARFVYFVSSAAGASASVRGRSGFIKAARTEGVHISGQIEAAV